VSLRVLIVPDKFKGTLTARQAAEAIAAGWRGARSKDRLDLLPMSDGGDGFGEVLGSLIGARLQQRRTINAARQPIQAQWWLDPKSRTAIIESAKIIGLALLPLARFHPFELDSFGLAAVLSAACARKPARLLVGAGGSATNDAGFGLARGLGWKFHDQNGCVLDQWWKLHRLARIQPPAQRMNLNLIVAVDVKNVLLGARGCSRVFGPQKGLRAQDMDLAENSLRRLANVLKRQLGLDCASVPGAGAAGGLAFGLMAFAGARIESGFDVFASAAGLSERIAACDLVITGEGKIDRQTHMGKGVGRVARLSARLKVPCVALAGSFGPPPQRSRFLAKMGALTELTTVENAQRRPAFFLRRLARETAAGMLRREMG
jgi:glycerate 2-kinase